MKLNNIVYPLNDKLNKEYAKIIYHEIFIDKHYHEGLKYIKKIKNPVVVDLGANIGLSVLYFSKKKDCKFYAVEPDVHYFKALLENVKDLDIKCYNISIGGANLIRYIDGLSFFFKERSDKAQVTRCMTLESFFNEVKIKHVDLLKIDVEGAEYEIFSTPGFESVADRIDCIIGEAHFKPYPCNPLNVTHLLERNNFKVKWLPIKNITLNWDIHLTDISGKEIVGLLNQITNTMFIAYKKLDDKTNRI